MRDHPEVGRVIGCDVYGGWNVDAAEADKFTRPLHSIETLYTIMGPGVVSVTCASTPTTESITAVWNDGRVGTYRGIKQGAVKYSATVFGEKGVSTAGIYGHGVPVNGIVPTTDNYVGYEGLAIEIARFFQTGGNAGNLRVDAGRRRKQITRRRDGEAQKPVGTECPVNSAWDSRQQLSTSA